METSLQNLSKQIKEKLITVYSTSEIDALLFLLFKHFLQLTSARVLAFPETKVSNSVKNQIMKGVERLLVHEPVQYVLGECEFYSMPFKVSPAVLIPRPETEELVDWIIKENTGNIQTIVDIGTGSGCIAIALAKHLKESKIFATDYSAVALEIASANAKLNQVKLSTLHHDILSDELPFQTESLDILVSNPPYVTVKEKSLMEKNVLDFEPHLALFVPDEDPLIFYRKLSETGLKFLKLNGKLYFEINEAYGKQLLDLLKQNGYQNIELRNDLFGKPRMIQAQKL